MRFATASFSLAADQLGEAQLFEIKQMFKHFDKDDNDTILVKELPAVVRNLGHNPSEAELASMMKEVDPDQSGIVEFQEFVSVIAKWMKLMEEPTEEELKEALRLFDRDGTGLLSADELAYTMGTIGEKLNEDEIADMMSDLEIDADGRINYEDFIKYLLARETV